MKVVLGVWELDIKPSGFKWFPFCYLVVMIHLCLFINNISYIFDLGLVLNINVFIIWL